MTIKLVGQAASLADKLEREVAEMMETRALPRIVIRRHIRVARQAKRRAARRAAAWLFS